MEMFDCMSHMCDPGYISSGDECEDSDADNLSHVGKAAYEVLRTKHNRQHHAQWNVTQGKIVGDLHQTPLDGWTRTEEYPDSGHDDWFPEKMGEIMSRTTKWCDLMSLGPPDGLFLDKIIEALKTIAKNSIGKEEPVIVRMMFGNIVGMPLNANKLIKILTKGLPEEANLHLWVGAWRRGASWNHAKIIAVDGKYLHTGGHNMWDKHYLADKPVHDLSFEMAGRIAQDGHLFANQQWSFIQYKQDTPCGRFVDKLPDNMILVAKTRVVISEYPAGKAETFAPRYSKKFTQELGVESPDDHVPVISMGRYGTIQRYGRPSDDAFVAMLGSAQKVIRLALQDLGPVCLPKTKRPLPGLKWPKNYISTLANVIYERGVDVEIALSNPNSIPGGLAMTEANYGNGWSCVDVAAEIIKEIQKLHPEAGDARLREIIASNLRVCFIRQARGNKYDDGNTVGMHAKHFIVDDVATYIGSQNLYVCDLAEWGVLVDDAASTKKVMDDYWNPMWKSSFTGEDCDVDAIMDGLKIDRDGEAGSMWTDNDLAEATAAMAHGNMDTGYYLDETEAEA